MNRSNPLYPGRLGGLLTARRSPRVLYAVSFFLPFFAIGLFWALSGVSPFGSKMILAHDQWHQYYPFYLDLRERLQNGGSLLHSWTGLGTSYLPLFAYYLASPLNLLAVLVPDSLALGFYTLTVLLRLSLCSLFFAIMLRRLFDRSDLTICFFSFAFALCAYLMGYYWNAIWLDTVALLPLVTLGTVQLLKHRKYVLYTVSLFLAIFCSYYIGLFVCIFVLLLFIGYNIVYWDDLGGFRARLLRIALFSLIAIGMTAFLTLPTFLALRSTSAAGEAFPTGFAINMSTDKTWAGVFEAFCKVVSNHGALIKPTTMEGLPNIGCGVCTLVLAFLYLLCRKIPLRERLYCVFLLLLFAASFIFRALDFVWHGLHFPKMLPYRFSFLWSFVVLFMAYRVFLQLPRVRPWQVIVLIVPVGFLLYCVVRMQGGAAILATAVIALLTLAGLLLYSLRRLTKTTLIFGICVMMLLESLSIGILGVRKVSVTSGDNYPSKQAAVQTLVETAQEREQGSFDLWRTEVATKQTLNDGALLGYRGISIFSSAVNSSVSQFMQSIGMAASVAGNRYSYQEADPFVNMLLGLKYLIDRDGRYLEPENFRRVAAEDEVLLLENRYYLPLGFLVSPDALEYDASEVSGLPYERLNRLFKLMTGESKPLYQVIERGGAEVLGSAKLVSSSDTKYSFTADDHETDSVLSVSYRIPYDGAQLCIYSKSSNCGSVSVYLNDEWQYFYSDKYGYLRSFGSFSEGDRVTLRFRPDEGETGSVTIGAALFDGGLFESCWQQLSENTMLTTLVSETEIEGAVSVRGAEDRLLYLSVPNDPGWSLRVDGEEAKITPVGGAMIACTLEPGLHSVALQYEAPGFALGLKISFICLGAFLIAVVIALLARLATPPLDKVEMVLADPDAEANEPPVQEVFTLPGEPRDEDDEDLPQPPEGATLQLPVLSGWDEDEPAGTDDEEEY